MSNICVKLICCVVNSDIVWNLHQSLLCGWDSYRRLTVQSSMSSNYHYGAIFFKFGEVIVEHCVYKRVFGFPLFYFYYLFIVFLFQSKTNNAVKNINQNFGSNKLKEKKSERHFVKKVICEYLLPQLISFEIFIGSWSSWK